MFSQLAIAAIGGYQKHISPHKGYRCAHRVYHDSVSCSEFGKRVIGQFGVWQGIKLLRWRLRDCRAALVSLREKIANAEQAREKQVESDENKGRASNDCNSCLPDAGCCTPDARFVYVPAGDACDCGIGGLDSCDMGLGGCDGCDVGGCDFL